MQIRTFILILSLAANIGIAVFMGKFIQNMGGPNHFWVRMNHSGASGIEMGRQSLFHELVEPRGGIVMLGDSLTHNAEWNELLGLPEVTNRGIIGQWAGQLAQEADYISPLKPDAVFLMMGVNDILANGPDTVADSLVKVVERIKRNSPNTRMFVQSVLPVNNNQRNTRRKNVDVVEINRIMKNYCGQRSSACQYIDLNSHFLDGGQQMDAKYATDGVHLNAAGYRLWSSLIKPYIQLPPSIEPTKF